MSALPTSCDTATTTKSRLHAFDTAERLAADFAQTAVERDRRGGTAKAERDQLRASGLLSLLVAEEDGGGGASWQDVLRIVRLFARVDSSIAHLYGFQHLMLATIELFGSEEQRRYYHGLTARHSWFWGNALNPLDPGTTATAQDGKRLLNGRKGFCSGSVDADALIVSANEPGNPRLLVAAVPLPREGLSILGDWDNMGQRQTDSGTVELRDVVVHDSEFLRSPGPFGSVRASLRPCVAQIVFTNVFLGIAEGAFQEARNYTLVQTKPWLTSGVSSPREDPYILRHYGELHAQILAAKLATEKAGDSLQRAWEEGDSLSENHRGKVALDIAAAKVLATRAGLEVTNRMFEVMGSRSTTAAARLDRFWRNLRTQTLHDPVEYKLRELGDWALNHQNPKPTFYS